MAEGQGMSIENLAQYFGAIEDPRCSGKVEHRLLDVLVIAVCAVVACAESWCDIALYGRSKLAWLRTFLGICQLWRPFSRAQCGQSTSCSGGSENAERSHRSAHVT
jgi:DDE_Tnp_1-associated